MTGPAPILLACPNCGEPLRLTVRASVVGRPRLTLSWGCATARGCEVGGEADVLLVPATDDEPVVRQATGAAA